MKTPVTNAGSGITRFAASAGLAALLAACGGTSAGGPPAPASAGPPSAAASAPASAAAKPASPAAAPASGAASPAAPAAAASGAASTARPASGSPAAQASGGAQGTPMKLGFSQFGVGYAPLFTARDGGFFSRNGLNVTLQQVQGPAAIPALLADEVQVDGLGANELSRSVLAGAPLTAVATLGDVPIFVLYADKKYKTIQDLAGQSIGVTALGSSTEVTARLFLEHYGMQGKVNVVAAGGSTPTVLAALSQGIVAAVIVSPDAGTQAAKVGAVPLVEGLKLGVPLNFSVIAVKTDYVKQHPDNIKAFLKAYQQTWSYLGDPGNKTAVVELLSKAIQTPADAVEAGYASWTQIWSSQKVPTINPEGITNTLKFSDDPKARSAKGEQFIDNSILQSIQ